MSRIPTRFRESLAPVGRRYQERYRARPFHTLILTYLLLLAGAILLFVAIAGYSAMMVRAQVNGLSDLLDNPGGLELSSEHVSTLHSRVHSLSSNVDRLNRLTSVPLIEEQLYELPSIGPRYESVRKALELGSELGNAGAKSATIGLDAYRAYDTNGISFEPDNEGDTWLEAIDRHRDEILEIIESIERARIYREQIDEAHLPTTILGRMDTLDSFLKRTDELIELAESYDDFFHAAGGEGTIRYLFLFKNPAELRPSGGFPGTFGAFEFNAGQLVDYEMWDSHDVTRDYIDNRSEKRQQPWPFEQFAPQDGFLLHDATWYSDFPYTAGIMMEMYAETTWPEINGIVAVQPETVSDLMRVTGPLMVDIDGELREINEDNVYDELERYRWLRFQGEREGELGDHKDILIDIGEAIMAEFTSDDDDDDNDVTEAIPLLADAASRRDLQIYIANPGVQEFLDRRGWSGKLFPDPDTPTLAITYTNFVLEKASMAMDPTYDLHLRRNEDGSYRATMHMTLEHTGLHDQDPRYFGFQRWWIEVALPEGAEWISSSHDRQPDPEAHDGGSYKVNLFPEETREIYVVFELPQIDELMLRRQPGQVPPEVHVHLDGCDPVWGGYLIRDLYIDLSGDCPELDEDEIEDEKPEMLQLS